MEPDAALVGQPPVTRTKHINKRNLKNKSLSIPFNEKDLRDYVGGFQKRKKKRRKEAYKQQEEKARRKRLEDRKRRRLEKAFALNGGAAPANDAEPESDDVDLNLKDESELKESLSGTTTFENGNVTVTVTTSEISREEVEEQLAPLPPLSSTGAEVGGVKKHNNIPVSKKKPFKKGGKGKSRPKLQSKRDKRKGKNSNSKRR